MIDTDKPAGSAPLFELTRTGPEIQTAGRAKAGETGKNLADRSRSQPGNLRILQSQPLIDAEHDVQTLYGVAGRTFA